MHSEAAQRSNVSPLDVAGKAENAESAKAEDIYIGARVDEDRRKRYDLAAVHGDFPNRTAFLIAACDLLADQILGATAAAQ